MPDDSRIPQSPSPPSPLPPLSVQPAGQQKEPGEDLEEEAVEEESGSLLVSVLDHYDALEVDSELMMPAAAQQDYSRLCNRSARAWASEVPCKYVPTVSDSAPLAGEQQ